MAGPEYVGSLRGVELEDGTYVPVRARALGVDGRRGVVTAANRDQLEAGRLDRRPKRRPGQKLRSLYYYRRRPQGDWWQHETPDARVVLSENGSRPDAWLSSPGSAVTHPGSFLTNPQGEPPMARARARKRLPPRNKKGRFMKRKSAKRRRNSTKRRTTRHRTRRNPPKSKPRTRTRTVYKTRWRTRKPARKNPRRRRPRARKNPLNPLLAAALVAGAATMAQGLIRTYVANPMIREYGPPAAMIFGGWWLMRKPKNRDLGLALAVVGAADIASMLVARFLPAATLPSAATPPAAPAATQGGLVNIAGGQWGGAFPRGSMFPNVRGSGPPILLQNNLPVIGAAEAFADVAHAPMLTAR